jgi:hypothetical protein
MILDPEDEAFNEIERQAKQRKEAVLQALHSENERLGLYKDAYGQQEPVVHWSDCGVHSEPAYPKSECDCGGFNPVAWLVEDVDGSRLYWTYKQPIGKEKWIPLFSTPPQREWVGLTDAEVESYWDWEDFQTGAGRLTIFEMVRDIEAKLKEKNNA